MPTPNLFTKGEAVFGKVVTRNGVVYSDGSTTTSASPQITSQVFVDYQRTDTYTANGSREFPYKTLAAAYTKAVALSPTANDAVRIILMSSNTAAQAESVTVAVGHIFILGDASSGTHAPVNWYGDLTFAAASGALSDNHFSVANLALIGVSGTTCITFSGTTPQRLFMKDVWVTANGAAHGITLTNTGTGSSAHIDDCKFSHNGSDAAYHCINTTAGIAYIDKIDTSGAGVGVIGVNGGTVNLMNSDIQAGGTYAIDVYATGVLTVANCKITTTAANSIGIKLVTSGAIALIGNVLFNVPTSATTGRAVSGVAGTYLWYTALTFMPDFVGGVTNVKISSAITSTAITTTPSFVA
jgi:hypothetical protein